MPILYNLEKSGKLKIRLETSNLYIRDRFKYLLFNYIIMSKEQNKTVLTLTDKINKIEFFDNNTALIMLDRTNLNFDIKSDFLTKNDMGKEITITLEW